MESSSEKVWGVRWPCLRTGVLCRCTRNPLKDLLVAEEALGSCSSPHVMDEGYLQVLFGVQHFVIQAGARIHSQSLQQSHS